MGKTFGQKPCYHQNKQFTNQEDPANKKKTKKNRFQNSTRTKKFQQKQIVKRDYEMFCFYCCQIENYKDEAGFFTW